MDATKGVTEFGGDKALVRVGDELGMAVYEPFGAFYRLQSGPWARVVRAKALRAGVRTRCPLTRFSSLSHCEVPPSMRVWSCALLNRSGVEFYPYVLLRSQYIVRCIDMRMRPDADHGSAWSLSLVVYDDRDWYSPPLELLEAWNWELETDRNCVVSATGEVDVADVRLEPFPPFEGPLFPTSETAFGGEQPIHSTRVGRYSLHRKAFGRRYIPWEKSSSPEPSAGKHRGFTESIAAVSFDRPAPNELGELALNPSCIARIHGAWGECFRSLNSPSCGMRFGPWYGSLRAEFERSSTASRRVANQEPYYRRNNWYQPPLGERYWGCSVFVGDPVETIPTVRHRGRRVHCFPPFYEKRADGSWDVGPGKAKFWVVRYIDEDRWRSDAAYLAELRGLEGEGWRFDLNEPGVVPAFIEGLIAEGDLEFIAGPPPEGPTGLVETD